MTVDFAVLEPVAPVRADSIELIRSAAGDEFADFVARTSSGYVADGFRLIDPAMVAGLTEGAVAPLDAGAVPVF